MRNRIGECLIQAGLITEEGLNAALSEQERTGERVAAVLVRLNLATEEQIAKALALQLGFPYVSLAEEPPDPAAVVLVPKDVARRRVCVAVRLENNVLTVAMADPLLFSVVQDLESQSGYRIRQVVAAGADIVRAIDAGYPDEALLRPAAPVDQALGRVPEEEMPEPIAGLNEPGGAASVVDLVDLVVRSAIASNASDIHIEPTEKGLVIRHRLDGLLKHVMDLPMRVHEALTARVKALAGMDIAEKRLPQEGRLRVTAEDGVDVDFRVSTLRTVSGEKIVIRVLDWRKEPPALDDLGMSSVALEEMRRLLRHQHGMILAVGPTGSGKTTTLGAALRSIQSERTNIVTIEDPVEYRIPGVNQTQIDEKLALTVASALRSILRQNPDVILVGELRDADTATLAMQAALTGPLVLSTLRTDDAPSCVTRLIDIGMEPSVVASALVGVVAQRLVRRLCVHCRRQETPAPDVLRSLDVSGAGASATPFYKAVGCEQCSHTGYRGRIGIYEVMRVDDTLRRLIAGRAPEHEIRQAAVAGGMATLGEDALAKVKAGITTPEELLGVVNVVRDMRALCPHCGTPVGVDFNACPHCGKRLTDGCAHCGRALQPGWNFCPYCARSADAKRSPRTLRDSEPRTRKRRARPSGKVAEFKK